MIFEGLETRDNGALQRGYQNESDVQILASFFGSLAFFIAALSNATVEIVWTKLDLLVVFVLLDVVLFRQAVLLPDERRPLIVEGLGMPHKVHGRVLKLHKN